MTESMKYRPPLATISAPRLERFRQRLGRRNRSFAVKTLGTRHGNQIDARIVDALTDPAILRRPATHLRDPFLMHLIVEVRSVVGDHDHHGNLKVGRRPECVHAHEIIAVADDTDGQPIAALEG